MMCHGAVFPSFKFLTHYILDGKNNHVDSPDKFTVNYPVNAIMYGHCLRSCWCPGEAVKVTVEIALKVTN